MKLIGSTREGVPDGSVLKAGLAHREHLRHYSVHVLAVVPGDSCKVVVRLRKTNVPRYPGMLTTTVGAHLLVGASPQDVIDEASKVTGVDLGPLAYVGTFEVADGVENEICTLWTGEADTTSALGTFLSIDVADAGQRLITPHLAESLKLWEAGR